MTTPPKYTELKRRQILRPTRISVPVGQNAYYEHPFDVEKVKPQHSIHFMVRVEQFGRTDLDVGFSVMDDGNFRRWLLKQPSVAYIVAPRFNFGTLTLTPMGAGTYHVVLDNRYSIFTSKEVVFSIYETWVEEKELEILKPEEAKIPKPKIGLLQRFLNKLRFSRQVFGFIALFVVIQLVCVLFGIGIAILLHSTLGVEYKDTMGYISTAIGASSIAILVYVYFLVTRRSLMEVFPMPKSALS